MNLSVQSQALPRSESEKNLPLPNSPFAWGLGRRLGVVAVLIAALWLAVAVALDWLGGLG